MSAAPGIEAPGAAPRARSDPRGPPRVPADPVGGETHLRATQLDEGAFHRGWIAPANPNASTAAGPRITIFPRGPAAPATRREPGPDGSNRSTKRLPRKGPGPT